jgi:uncharacterized protein involved in exopolysaccharide biosynthesis
VDIATSNAVALRVASRLGLEETQEHRERFLRAAGGEGQFADWLAEELLKRLSIQPARESRVMQISYSAAAPRFAARVANAFAQAYVDMHLELNTGPARRNSAWLQEQVKILRGQVEQAQARLTDFQQRNQILSGDDKFDTEMQRFEDLSKQFSAAQSQTQEARSRRLGEEHPLYRRALAHEQILEQAVAQQKARVLKLKHRRDQIAVLIREMEGAQRTYDTALQQYKQASLNSQASQTNVSILNHAVIPARPSNPKPALNIGVGAALGLLLGVGAALLREILNRRIRTEEDLVQGLGLPFLGALDKART